MNNAAGNSSASNTGVRRSRERGGRRNHLPALPAGGIRENDLGDRRQVERHAVVQGWRLTARNFLRNADRLQTVQAQINTITTSSLDQIRTVAPQTED